MLFVFFTQHRVIEFTLLNLIMSNIRHGENSFGVFTGGRGNKKKKRQKNHLYLFRHFARRTYSRWGENDKNKQVKVIVAK